MHGREPLARFDRLIVPALGLIAATELFCLMLLTCVDVIGRYFFSSPVAGGFEITEMLLAGLIFSALPLVTLRGEHVTVRPAGAHYAGTAAACPTRHRLPRRLRGHRLSLDAALGQSRQPWMPRARPRRSSS